MQELKAIWIIMCVFCTAGILSQILFIHTMLDLKKGNAVVRQIKLKFATCRKLEIQINNTQVFVEKMMDGYRKFGMPLRMLASAADAAAHICILLGLIGMYISRNSVPELVMIAGLSAACFCMLRVITILVDGRESIYRLTAELVDSLENYGRSDNAIPDEEPVTQKHFSREAESEFNKMNKTFDRLMQENVIMEVIEEYL